VTAVCAVVGLLLVIWAASLVIIENSRLRRLLESDVADLPELTDDGRPPKHV
jgi:hypothetical protein